MIKQIQNKDLLRRIIGALFLMAWLGVSMAEKLGLVPHGTESLAHVVEDYIPLLVGLMLFAPDLKDFVMSLLKRGK